MSGSIVQYKTDITAIITQLVQADGLLNHIKKEQDYDPRQKPSLDRRNASELQIILNDVSNPSTNFSMFGGRVLYVKPKVVEANLNANGKAALFHFIWMMGKDNYEDAFHVFSSHITTIRSFFAHEMDVLAWQIGQLSLTNRMKQVKKLTNAYGTMDLKSYEAFLNHFGLYMTLTGPTKLLLPKNELQSIAPFIRKHDVPQIFSSGSTKSGYFINVRKAIIEYLGVGSKQQAINELHVRCPLLMFLPKHFSRSELVLFYANKNAVSKAVSKIENILTESNTTYKSYLGDNPSRLNKKMLLPLYSQAFMGLKQVYPKSTHPFLTSVINFEKTKAKTDEIADILSVISNVCTGLGLFFGFTPMAVGSSVFFGIAGLSEKSIAFLRAAYDVNIRKALRAYPDGGGFLTIAKKGDSLADEIALVLLELAFLAPGVKQVATTRRALAKEAKIIRKQHEAIRRLDHSYREQLKHIRLTYAIRHQTGRKFPKTNLDANKKALAENKIQRIALLHDRGLTQSRLAASKAVHERLLRMSLEALEASAISLQIQRREIQESIKMAENYRNQLMQMLSDSSVPRRHIEQAIAGIEHMDAKYTKQLLNNSRSIAAVDESLRTFSPESFAKSMQNNRQTMEPLEVQLKELNSSIDQLSETQRKLVQSITYDEQLIITTNNMEMQRIFSGILEQEQRLRHQYLKDRKEMLNVAKESMEKQKALTKPLSEDLVKKEGFKGGGMEAVKQTSEFGISTLTKETTPTSNQPYGPQLIHHNSNKSSKSVPIKKSKSTLKKQRATAQKNRGL